MKFLEDLYTHFRNPYYGNAANTSVKLIDFP